MPKKQSDLLVITKTRDLANYVFTITHKSPKEYRFSIVNRMQNYVLDAVENLYRANAVQLTPQTIMNREHYQREAMTAYRLLGTVAQIGNEQGAITAHQLEQIAMQANDCDHLMRAHKVARLGKRGNTEVVEFEADLLGNIANLHQRLMNGTYHQRNYYHFTIYDPKVREIYALHYIDRIVQHCLCDNLLAPWFDTHVIYDNAACRLNKGTHFAMNRMDAFLLEHYKHYGTQGYILKCDISKYFNNIDHEILKGKLFRIFRDEQVRSLLNNIIDSYEVTPGKGIPLRNQTSQWFAILYIDELDRYVKEQRRIKHYTRYMDDFILIHPEKTYLMETLQGMEAILKKLGLSFNSKTQVFPISHGVEYLGRRFYLTDSGAVIRRLKKHSKTRWKHRLRKLKALYADGTIDLEKIKESIQSFANHMSYGNTWKMLQKEMNRFVLRKNHTKQSLTRSALSAGRFLYAIFSERRLSHGLQPKQIRKGNGYPMV